MVFAEAEPTYDLRCRRLSSGGLVHVGVYRVLYGVRIRAGFTNDKWGVTLDWCAGAEWWNVEALYSACITILSLRDENRNCFKGIPQVSNIKPFFNDLEFCEALRELSQGQTQLLKLQKPDWGGLDPLISSILEGEP